MGRVSHGIGHLRYGDRSTDVRPRLGWWCGGSGGPEGAGVVVRAVVLRSKTVVNSGLFRCRCCPHGSSGARDRFSSHPRVSNRSASPRARRLSTCINRKTLGKNRRLSVNAPAGSEWRRCTPFKRPVAHVMSPTHSRHALHDPPTSDISQHVVSAESRRHRGPSDTRTISTPHGAPTASHRRRPSIPRPR